MRKQDFAGSVHSAINKGLGVANAIVGSVGTFKGLYEIGQFMAANARALAPAAGAVAAVL